MIATTYRLVIPGRPFAVNASTRSNWPRMAALVHEWRELGWITAKQAKLPKLTPPVTITAQSHLKGQRSRDVLSDALCIKAALDGALVDSKCLPDDSPAYVASVLCLAPLLAAERDALVIEIEAL